MPLTTYLISPFEHEHESTMFDRLAVSLANRTDKVTDHYILIGNITVNGGDLDALLVKTDGISVIEFKAHGGLVVFDENLPWQVGTSRVRGEAGQTHFCRSKFTGTRFIIFLRKNPKAFFYLIGKSHGIM